MTICEELKGLCPDFSEEKCFGLVVAASLNRGGETTAKDAYGFTLTDNKGNLVYTVLFGTSIPDSALAYDGIRRDQVMSNVTFVDAYTKLCALLPEGAILFSANAGKWAHGIFESIPKEFPAAVVRNDLKHVDIASFCEAINTGNVPKEGEDIVSFTMRNALKKRMNLMSYAAVHGIKPDLSLTGPEQRAVAVGELLAQTFEMESEK